MINDYAEIVPGKSAAGFNLGSSISEVKASISDLKEWRPTGEVGLYEAIRSELGWLSYERESGGGRVLYFGGGMIELHFSAKGILFNIFISDGYAGALWEEIKVGSALSVVQSRCPLKYDEGDEMHYPAEESAVVGVAFYAEELPLDEAPDQLISGISVHDWTMGS